MSSDQHKVFFKRMSDLRDTWATDSNATTDEEVLRLLCERFIAEMELALIAAGGHPEPPPPRIRP